jgi:hypothetical protein
LVARILLKHETFTWSTCVATFTQSTPLASFTGCLYSSVLEDACCCRRSMSDTTVLGVTNDTALVGGTLVASTPVSF